MATIPPASATPEASRDQVLRGHIVAFIQRAYGFRLDHVEVKTLGPADASGLRKAVLHLKTKDGQELDQDFYVTADGRKILQGEVNDLNGDPWRSNRLKLKLAGAPTDGPATAPVTIVEFSDLECPYCKQEATSLKQVMQDLPGQVRLVFKLYPLVRIHPWSMQAAVAATCVAEQGDSKFWAFEQSVFDHQEQLTPDTAPNRLHDFALESGVDAGRFEGCLHAPAAPAKVQASIREGDAIGVNSTPTLFINGREIASALDPATLKGLVQNEAKLAPEFDKLDTGLKGEQCGKCEPLPPPKP